MGARGRLDFSLHSVEMAVLEDIDCSMNSLSDGSGPASETSQLWEPWLKFAT